MGCQDIKSLNYVVCFINDITVTIIVDTNYHCTSRKLMLCSLGIQYLTFSNIYMYMHIIGKFSGAVKERGKLVILWVENYGVT